MTFAESDIETTIIPSPRTRYAATEVGVRVRHIRSGIIAESTNEPSQYLNKKVALSALSRLLNLTS